MAPDPVFDSSKHHVTVHGREESGQQAAFQQNGHYFDGEGNYLEDVHPSGKTKAERDKDGARAATKPTAKPAAPAAAASQVDKQLGS